jgi:hypothetical protein
LLLNQKSLLQRQPLHLQRRQPLALARLPQQLQLQNQQLLPSPLPERLSSSKSQTRRTLSLPLRPRSLLGLELEADQPSVEEQLEVEQPERR